MKIKTYFAVIILSCLVCGYFLEIIISKKQFSVESLSNKTVSDQFLIDEFERFQKEIIQFYISTDLVLGSGETYLINGAVNKGDLLSTSLSNFLTHQDLFKNEVLLIEAKHDINRINSLLLQSQDTPEKTRQATLDNFLIEYDNIAKQLDSSILEIGSQVKQSASNRKSALTEEKNTLKNIRVLGASGFGIILIGLWIWAYKQVCNPLHTLKKSAETSLINFNSFEGVKNGPKEVLELSDSLTALTNTLSYQASHDSLTKLNNRREFKRRLRNCIVELNRNGQTRDVLCYLDLDQFKIVNDSCGHVAGDGLLKLVANILKEGIRKSDFLARVGGDEFCIIFYQCDIDTALALSNKLRDDIENLRYLWEGRTFHISASIGLTEINSESATAYDALNAADTACSVAKDLGRNRVYAYTSSDTQLERKRSEMSCINQIQSALEENRFILYRQDIVSIDDKVHEMDHFEVLIRMLSESGEIISPYVFLPTAERYHLATQLDVWVVSNTFDFFMNNPIEVNNLEVCNINLSGQSFSNQNMADFIIDKLIASNIPGNKICFEITETAAVTDIKNAQKFIAKLKGHGCLFALDDFGSGLSSFQYLKDLPVDFVKIDGAFVKNMVTDEFDIATVKSINDIAKAGGKKTVAEFVETIEIVNKLKEIGIDYAQGYYFDAPKPMVKQPPKLKSISNF
ncbi:MAG: putative bifunctional diguanylate cyclase/phosphodiesterase [Gammaproteobacteria bacterium]